ncbi:MAG: glycosyltransferase family 4 protein [Burkholderiales bacterium]|nr:glycosyltransferase family 4 protein [Burkholderiales bacterium]
MEIGIVRQRYTPYGGAERFVADALAALKRENVGLTLYTRKWPGGDGAFSPVVCNPFYIGSVWRDWSFARAVRESWERHRPDLIQSHERIAGCDVFRAGDGVHRVWLEQRARGMSPLRRVGLALNPYHHYTLAAEARLFADPDLRAVICNSRLVRDQIRARFGVPESRLHVIYNAVDCARFTPASAVARSAARNVHGLPATATVFALVGSGYDRKGVVRAMAALARQPDDVWLVVAGKEKRLAHYRALAERFGVAARTRLAGALDEVAPLLGAADAFVLPTVYDPLPNACLEAMAAGLPVITSTQCGAAELLSAHDAGIVCDAYDAPALAAAMTRLLDPALRAAMGARARRAVLPFNAEAMAAQLVGLYRSLLGLKAPPRTL